MADYSLPAEYPYQDNSPAHPLMSDDYNAVLVAVNDLGAAGGRVATLEAGGRTVDLPASNGTDDTDALNTILADAYGKRVRGRPGETYLVGAPLVLPPGGNIHLDMTGCQVQGIGTTMFNLLQNHSFRNFRAATATTTAGSTTLTSADAAFTAADRLQWVKVPGANVSGDLLVAQITAVTNATTVTLSIAAQTVVTAAAIEIHNNDTDIIVEGGYWDHQPAGIERVFDYRDHAIVMKYCERLRMFDMTHHGTTGKYRIHAGGLNYAYFNNHFFDNCPSDGIHICGPAYWVDIDGMQGYCNDDMFVLTGQESSVYPYNYNDCIGPIEHVTGSNIHKDGGNARVAYVSPGRSGSLKDIKIRNVSGHAQYYGVMVEGDLTLRGGTIEDLVVENVSTTSDLNLAQIFFQAVTAGKVTIDGVYRSEPSTTQYAIRANGSTIDALTIRNVRLHSPTNQGLLRTALDENSFATNIHTLVIEGVKITGPTAVPLVEFLTSGQFESVTLRNWDATFSGNAWLLRLNGTIQTDTVLLDNIRSVNTSGTPAGALIQATNTGSAMPTLFLSNVHAKGSYFLADLNTATDLYLSNVFVEGNTQSLNVGAAAAVVVRGRGIKIPTSALTVTSGGTLRVDAADFPVDTAKINAASTGDMVRNTNSASPPYQVGTATYSGTEWRRTSTGVQGTGTATLVGGTATVADTRITANSVVRLAGRTVGGTPGAPYVSAKTAGASFVITSTSPSDTSVIQYDVLAY